MSRLSDGRCADLRHVIAPEFCGDLPAESDGRGQILCVGSACGNGVTAVAVRVFSDECRCGYHPETLFANDPGQFVQRRVVCTVAVDCDYYGRVSVAFDGGKPLDCDAGKMPSIDGKCENRRFGTLDADRIGSVQREIRSDGFTAEPLGYGSGHAERGTCGRKADDA